MRSNKRIVIVGLIFTLFSIILLSKLAHLQWFPSGHIKTVQGQLSYSRNWRYQAVKQRQNSVLLHDGRALYIDEQGQLIHKKIKYRLLLTPYFIKNRNIETIIGELSSILKMAHEEVREQLHTLARPAWLKDASGAILSLTANQVKAIEEQGWFGLYLLKTIEPDYDSAFIHAIGFTAQNPQKLQLEYRDYINQRNNWSIRSVVGVNGLERSFERFLYGVEQEKVAWYEDARGKMIEGLGINFIGKHPYYPLTVQTTINMKLQEAIQQLVREHKEGHIAVVLLDVETNNIKAMVSKPELFPGELDNNDMLKNLAVSSHRPGSIYKIITLAAALEFGVVTEEEQFYCNGEYGKFGLSCWKEGGHGKQSLQQAFANSCNVAFAQLSERLNAEQLHQTALALGGIKAIGWSSHNQDKLTMLIEEENGRAFVNQATNDRGEIAQTSIGQRDALINPLQAASIAATIARGGQSLEARLATQISFSDGKLLQQFKPHKLTASPYKLKARTISILQHYMQAVVQIGTGQLLKQASVEIAGKSGTAQLGSAKSSRNNYWFVGYFPAREPQYALAVVVLNEKVASNPATKLFGEIVNLIYENKHSLLL